MRACQEPTSSGGTALVLRPNPPGAGPRAPPSSRSSAARIVKVRVTSVATPCTDPEIPPSRQCTARTRYLGAELATLRERSGRSQADVARHFGWTQSIVTRMEQGFRAGKQAVTMYLGLLGSTVEHRDELLALLDEPHAGYWVQPHDGRVPEQVPGLRHTDITAVAVTEYAPVLVPALVQTRDYTRALLADQGMAGAQIPDAVAARAAVRDRLLARDAPQCLFFLAETALDQSVGDHRVGDNQLTYLIEMAMHRTCQIRLIPAECSLASLGPGFRLLDHLVRRYQCPPVVAEEHFAATLLFERTSDVRAYQERLNHLDEIALDVGATGRRLATLARARGLIPPEPHDDPVSHQGNYRTT